MESPNNSLNMYQKTLDSNKDMKTSFIDAEVDESESEDDRCEIIIPKRKKKRGIDTGHELLFQLIDQHKVLVKTQKKMYKLQAELDKEEISTRYIKLDLNNTQVKLEDSNVKLKECQIALLHSRVENWVVRVISVVYILYTVWIWILSFSY
jgi:hypothetical protein